MWRAPLGSAGGSWLRALAEVEKLRFTAGHADAEISAGQHDAKDAITTRRAVHPHRSAVCGEHEMRWGRLYTTFTHNHNHPLQPKP